MQLMQSGTTSVTSSDEFDTLPKSHSLLCCVCHEHNTTFRYEVIYKSKLCSNSETANAKNSDLVEKQVTLTTSIDDSSENEYYNFPPRHPRHGHLKWPVFRPSEILQESICITTYPDYPVHLPTFTLKRVASVIRAHQHKGKILESC